MELKCYIRSVMVMINLILEIDDCYCKVIWAICFSILIYPLSILSLDLLITLRNLIFLIGMSLTLVERVLRFVPMEILLSRATNWASQLMSVWHSARFDSTLKLDMYMFKLELDSNLNSVSQVWPRKRSTRLNSNSTRT